MIEPWSETDSRYCALLFYTLVIAAYFIVEPVKGRVAREILYEKGWC